MKIIFFPELSVFWCFVMSLIVVDATNDDASVAVVNPHTLDTLGFFRGDCVQLKGPRDTLCILIGSESIEEGKISLCPVLRSNLYVNIGDTVQVDGHTVDIVEYLSKVLVLPLADTLPLVSCLLPIIIHIQNARLFEGYLQPYFLQAFRPVRKGTANSTFSTQLLISKGDLFVKSGVEFQIREVEIPSKAPAIGGIVSPQTILYCEGEPLSREEAVDYRKANGLVCDV